MARYEVEFATPVVVQPHNPQKRREVTVLEVHAPDAESAKAHALKRTFPLSRRDIQAVVAVRDA